MHLWTPFSDVHSIGLLSCLNSSCTNRGLHVRESLHLAQVILLKGIKNQKEKKVGISHSEGSKLSDRFP